MSLFGLSASPSTHSSKQLTERPATARMTWMVGLVVMAITLLALGRIAGHSFVDWDDPNNLTENPHLQSIGYCWLHQVEHFYIPVTYTVWGLLAFVAGDSSGTGAALDPRVFHVASLAFHVMTVIGVLMVLRRIGLRPWPAGFGALIFAVHPLQSEAVAWATGLRDILSGGLCIWGIWFYLRTVEFREHSRRWSPQYVFATLLFILGMLSKPQAVCLPLVIFGIEVLRRPRAWRQWIAYLLPWFALTVPLILFTRQLQPAVAQHLAASRVQRVLIASDDLVFYFDKLIVPIDLTVDYARTTQRLLQNGPHVLLWFVLPALLLLTWYLHRRLLWLAIGIAIFVCALIPVLGFVPFDYQTYSNVANHYVYLAMLGPALIGACALQSSAEHGFPKLAAAAVGAVLTALMAASTFVQAGYWKDDLTLFSRNLQLQPDSFVANSQVGRDYYRHGRPDDAMVLYRRALTIKPWDGETRFNVANWLTRHGRLDEAVDDYRIALQEWPLRAEIHLNLGVALANQGKIDEAISEFQTSDQLSPGNPKVLMELGMLSMQRQDVTAAKKYFSSVLAIDPNFTPARAMLQQIEQFEQSQRPK